MNNEKIKELREKILNGIELAYEKLLKEKQKENGELAFYENDKIIIVKVNDLVS